MHCCIDCFSNEYGDFGIWILLLFIKQSRVTLATSAGLSIICLKTQRGSNVMSRTSDIEVKTSTENKQNPNILKFRLVKEMRNDLTHL